MLQEIRADIDSLKEKISALEARLADISSVPDETEEVDFTDVEIGVADVPAPAEVEVSSLVAEEKAEAPADETSTSPNPDGVEVASFVADNRAEAPEPVEDDTVGLPWRKDYPGMEVKNIRSGISLNDRALFITTLFKEDFQLYDQTIQDLNQMNSLQEAIDYIRSRFPLWNLKSDVVYHFMMCVRKKLR